MNVCTHRYHYLLFKVKMVDPHILIVWLGTSKYFKIPLWNYNSTQLFIYAHQLNIADQSHDCNHSQNVQSQRSAMLIVS